MNSETARVLAQAVQMRRQAERGMMMLLRNPSDPAAHTLTELAATYVHEDRIINKIISEAVDE